MKRLLGITEKINNRIWKEIVLLTRNKNFYYKLYRSYWYSLMNNPKGGKLETNYYSAIPNRGAGIGHQLANWIAGYWYAQQFGLHFAHIPFSEKWESFLGFGDNEISVRELVKSQGYKILKLPLFDEDNIKEVNAIKHIIQSYNDKKVVFVAEQDQFYAEQFGVSDQIKQKFHSAKARNQDKLIYSKENFNIAIHIRRGDITVGKNDKNSNLGMRWQDNGYFEKILSTVLDCIKFEKVVFIYLFSQGERCDFEDFEKFENIHFCLEMNAQDSFLHIVNADLLITSKSSFSYKPALLSYGTKVCPRDFWHGYPNNTQWILVENDGSLNNMEAEKLKKTLSEKALNLLIY